MSFYIKGQKFLGNDLELIHFIQNDLSNFFSKEFNSYFNNKETAIKVGEKIKLHIQKEEHELKLIEKILGTKDITLVEQQNIIRNNKTEEVIKERIRILKSCFICSSYFEILKKLQQYYRLKEYSILLDLNYLSIDSTIVIFSYKEEYYTSLQTDNEDTFIQFLLESKKFKDYTFDFNQTEDKKISDKELAELIEKEKVWKNIYSLITVEEKNKTQIATSFYFDIFANLNISNEREKELFILTTTNMQ